MRRGKGLVAATLGAVIVVLSFFGGCATPARNARSDGEDRLGLFQQLNSGYGREGVPGSRDSVGEAKVADAGGEGDGLGVSLVRPLAQVVVTSPFGRRDGEYHDGIDLKASIGTPVYASHSGLVLYADRRIRGYGNMVVIKHASGVSTIYAHNSRLFVKRGSRVIQGQRIALSGATGNAKGPHLHYEIRKGMSPVDPEPLLARAAAPKRYAAARTKATAGPGKRQPASFAPGSRKP